MSDPTPPLSAAQRRMLSAYERHVGAEFVTQKVEDAMATMVDSPHVTNIPSLAGGYGRDAVEAFYREQFVFAMPADMELVPVSRTVGNDTIVEEYVLRFTHNEELVWMLPGVAPTGRRVELAVCTVVKMEGEKVAHEHIYWDQGSVLAQLGLIDEDLPVVGAEGARKILDPALPVKTLFERTRSEGE